MDNESDKFIQLTFKEIGLFFALGGALTAVALGFLTILALAVGVLV